jgi:glucose-6-phosphate 1-dehydrogenase
MSVFPVNSMALSSTASRNFPTVMVIFGATGDLMSKKIVPSLFDLFQDKKLPNLFRVVGYSRRDFSEAEFRSFVSGLVTTYKGVGGVSSETLEAFTRLFSFVSGPFDDAADYEFLGQALGKIDGEWRVCANKLFYLAVAPEFYPTICTKLHSSGLADPCSPEEGWTRIIVEKPFGKDLKTAEQLDKLLAKLFQEVQIYRIDHYLAKEMIQNILTFRFSNDLFEHEWNKSSVESIDIRLWETLGVEERGAFYDGVGALRDVGQNHLLQMLAFVTMEEPAQMTAENIRRKRSELLQKLILPNRNDIKKSTFRAQYKGYQSIKNVDSSSTTETYFKVIAYLDDERWAGVPISIESGKRLGERKKDIVVNFKHPTPCFCPPESEHMRNRVIFSMEPQEGITIEFWSKKPGLTFELEKRSLNFLLRGDHEQKQYVEEYKKLLIDCIEGDQTLFVSTDEMRAMWAFVDPIVSAWKKDVVPLATYTPDTAAITEEFMVQLPGEKTNTLKKEIAIVGLGKMGANIARHLHNQGWRVIGFNRSPDVALSMEKEGVLEAASSLADAVGRLTGPRLVWLMVPAGLPVEEMLFAKQGLAKLLSRNDVVIDGGNSFYKDAAPRAKKLLKHGIKFLDVGTSGGPRGALEGACLMVGGEESVFKRLEPLFSDLSRDGSYAFFPGFGAGHFVKMVHNGIEYGMMQAIAEGFEVLKKSAFKLDLDRVARIYNQGSVIASRLVGWMRSGFKKYGVDLKKVSSTVAHTGEGAWTVDAAKQLGVPVPIIKGSLVFRKQSGKKASYTGKVLSMLRGEFGGHDTKLK